MQRIGCYHTDAESHAESLLSTYPYLFPKMHLGELHPISRNLLTIRKR